ncbi:acyloxyacyl hydrolase [Solimicrobium silvestre]
MALKFQHFSNASIKKPNPAMNFALIKLGYAF